MKSFIITFVSFCLVLAVAPNTNAQINGPAPSPFCKVEQTIGLTDIVVEYSRPGKKGREIFGDLVPYGEVWRLGANAATKMSFSTDVTLNGTELEAGEYAVLCTPEMTQWTLHFYPYNSASFGSYLQDEDAEPINIVAEVGEMGQTVQSFFIFFDHMLNNSGVMLLGWDKVVAPVEIGVPTEEMMEDMIASTMDGPSAGDFYSAAVYYLAEGKDMNKALEWINMAIDKGGERFWILRQKSEIQAELGDYEGAIATAKRSKELAMDADNQDYIKINNDNIEKWSNM